MVEKYIEAAKKASENAYAPYSNFKVGACLIVGEQMILGSNVENASYGLSMCAERNVIFQAYNQGYRKHQLKMIVIYNQSSTLISPCGACLQVMCECMDDDSIVIVANDHCHKQYLLKQLLPIQFNGRNLNEL